ncbi:MAG TPA: hypothetical protein VGI58_00650 [Streptosporangiaceae bacterium]|jgi:hypothetical protein
MRKRRREDLAAAQRLSEEFALGEVRGVTRSRADRPYREGLVGFASATVILGAVGLVALVVFVVSTAFVRWPPVLAIVIISVAGVVGVGYYVGSVILNHSFAPGTETDRVFWFAGGLAHLVTAEAGPSVLRWAGVDSVTETLLDEALWYYGWLYTCTVRGAGTEISLVAYDDATVRFARHLDRRLIGEARRLLGPRFVPPLIEAYESGEPATIGAWTVDRTGITASTSEFVTDFCPWRGITRIAFEHKPIQTGPVARILVYTDGEQAALEIGLSDVPNGIFLPDVIAHAATSNGVKVGDHARKRQRLTAERRESAVPSPPG